jgi:recombination protein RecT
MNQQIEPVPKEKYATFKGYLQRSDVGQAIQDAVPKWLTPDRLLRVIYSQALTTPAILDCTPASILKAVINCAYLGLEPVLNRAWLIPYEVNHVLTCQFQIGYMGLVDLARRSGEIKVVKSMLVYETDDLEIEFGLEETFRHRRTQRGDARGEIIGVYTRWTWESGFINIPGLIDIEDIEKRRNVSRAYQYGVENPKKYGAQDSPWFKWPETMIEKTALKIDSKLQPMSIDFMEAVSVDNLQESKPDLNPWANINLPETKQVSYTETSKQLETQFDTLFKNERNTKVFKKFFELARESNTPDGAEPLTDEEVKIMAMNDAAGANFAHAFENYKKAESGKSKATTKRGAPKKKPTPKPRSKPTEKKEAVKGEQAQIGETELKNETRVALMGYKDKHPDLYAEAFPPDMVIDQEKADLGIDYIHSRIKDLENDGPPGG